MSVLCLYVNEQRNLAYWIYSIIIYVDCWRFLLLLGHSLLDALLCPSPPQEAHLGRGVEHWLGPSTRASGSSSFPYECTILCLFDHNFRSSRSAARACFQLILAFLHLSVFCAWSLFHRFWTSVRRDSTSVVYMGRCSRASSSFSQWYYSPYCPCAQVMLEWSRPKSV